MDNQPTSPERVSVDERIVRWLCFMVLSTAGMGAIGASILAEPMAVYYTDKAAVQAHQKRLADLQQLDKQLGELLQNANQPAVIERAAINNLRYVPDEAISVRGEPLPKASPPLEKALKKIDTPKDEAPGAAQEFFETLATHHVEQTLLLILGSGLVVVSMTFFNRPES